MMDASANQPDEARRLTFTRVTIVAVLGLLVWPLPAMITFANPEEAQVLGRYTAQYAAFLGVYIAAVLVWAGITLWSLLGLKPPTFARLRRWAGQHPFLVSTGWTLAALALLAVRVVTLARLKAFPGSFNDAMVVLPSLLLVAIAVLAALIADNAFRATLEGALARLWPAKDDNRGSTSLERTLAWAGMALLGAVVLVSVLRKPYWDYPINVDSGMHIYVGQHVLNGGVPFQTVIVEYGPMRYVISTLWGLGARLTGLPVAIFARWLDIAASLGILLVTFGMGRRMTKRPLGGLLAASIVLGTELLFDLLLGGPMFRLTTTLLMALAVLAGQHERWFWAGLLAVVVAMLYTPMVMLVLALLIAAVLQGETPRWRTLGKVAAGSGLMLALALIVLTALGLTADAYRLVLGTVIAAMTGQYAAPGTPVVSANIFSKLPWHWTLIQWNLRGDWELAVLMAAGLLISLFPRRLRDTLRAPQTVVPLVMAGLMLGSMLIDEGDATDTILRVVLLAPFGAMAVVEGLDVLGRAARKLPYLRAGQLAVAAAVIIIIGLADSTDHQRYLHSLTNITLREQQHMADDLAATLEPGETVLNTVNLWYQALASQDNALPIRRFGHKLPLLQFTGWTPERALAALEPNPPVVVMWLGPTPDNFREWLQADYDYMGYLDPDSRFFEQKIYVLKGQDDVEAVVEKWPLEEGEP
jgi:hypothetical protein